MIEISRDVTIAWNGLAPGHQPYTTRCVTTVDFLFYQNRYNSFENIKNQIFRVYESGHDSIHHRGFPYRSTGMVKVSMHMQAWYLCNIFPKFIFLPLPKRIRYVNSRDANRYLIIRKLHFKVVLPSLSFFFFFLFWHLFQARKQTFDIFVVIFIRRNYVRIKIAIVDYRSILRF